MPVILRIVQYDVLQHSACIRLHSLSLSLYIYIYIHTHTHEDVPGGKVNILGGHSICYSKQKCLCAHVLFRTVSEIELFECTTAKLLIRKRYYVYVLFLIPVFIVHVTGLVQFMNVRKFHRQHQCTLQLV